MKVIAGIFFAASGSHTVFATHVSVVGDATYDIPGPVCSGPTNKPPHALACPGKHAVAVAGCHRGLISFNAALGQCIAPFDALCTKLTTGDAWGCVFPRTAPTEEYQLPSGSNEASYDKDPLDSGIYGDYEDSTDSDRSRNSRAPSKTPDASKSKAPTDKGMDEDDKESKDKTPTDEDKDNNSGDEAPEYSNSTSEHVPEASDSKESSGNGSSVDEQDSWDVMEFEIKARPNGTYGLSPSGFTAFGILFMISVIEVLLT